MRLGGEFRMDMLEQNRIAYSATCYRREAPHDYFFPSSCGPDEPAADWRHTMSFIRSGCSFLSTIRPTCLYMQKCTIDYAEKLATTEIQAARARKDAPLPRNSRGRTVIVPRATTRATTAAAPADAPSAAPALSAAAARMSVIPARGRTVIVARGSSAVGSAEPDAPPDPDATLVVDVPFYDPGLFSFMATIVGAVDAYERGTLVASGLRVSFDKGRWLDESRGSNWWEYHMEPVCLGRQDGPVRHMSSRKMAHAELAFSAIVLDRNIAAPLVRRHIRPRAHVLEEVAAFRMARLQGRHVVGVHYRGTDKPVELQTVASYVDVLDAVSAEVAAAASRAARDVAVFVASDEEDFVAACRGRFPGMCVHTAATRSTLGGPAVHRSMTRPYDAAREALVDCLLLAGSDVLVRTSSNLGQFAGFFSPGMRVTRLNRSNFEKE